MIIPASLHVLLSVPTYVDGKPKPYYRGFIHLTFCIIFATAAVAASSIYILTHHTPSSTLTSTSTSASKNKLWLIGLILLLLGKSLSYFASSLLHIYPFSCRKAVTAALKGDLIAISVSIGFTTMPFVSTFWEFNYVLISTAVFTLIQFVTVEYQFYKHVGLDTPANRTDVPRNVALVIQFLQTCYIIGERLQYTQLYVVGVIAYIIAFVLAAPVTQSHLSEPIFRQYGFFWHKLQVNSLHEDFHGMLLIADLMMVYMALVLEIGVGNCVGDDCASAIGSVVTVGEL